MGTGQIVRSSEPPTADRVRHDIDRVTTGDMTDVPVAAAAALGTDDEAAGRPPTRQQLRMEDRDRAPPKQLTASNGPVIVFAGVVAAFAAGVTIVVVLF